MTAFVRFSCQAHPRVSGENLVALVTFQVVRGSSPRERGKLDAAVDRVLSYRLIPA